MKKTVPPEVITDAQEQLAWGIINYEQKAIKDAIKAGANPFTCHKTKLAGPYYLESRIETSLDAEELSPYYLLFKAKFDNKAARQALLDTATALLKLGISVDNKPSHSSDEYGTTFTFREQVDQWLKEIENEETAAKSAGYVLTKEQKEGIVDMTKTMTELLVLMKSHQPEPADLEYVSSFS